MEQTINAVKGSYILLFIIASAIAFMWVALAGIYAVYGTVGLVLTCAACGVTIFAYCLKTYERFDLIAFKSQKNTIAGLNDTCTRQQKTLNKMLAHETDQGRLIGDMMLTLSMDEEENWYEQLAEARKIAARMKASIVAVRKV